MSSKTVLITGATGFIGRNLVEHYAQSGYQVRATYHQRPPFETADVEWIRADLRHPEDVQKALKGVNILIQAAATTSGSKDIVTRPYIHVTDNAVMNAYLLREAYEQSVEHVIFFSCTVMYQSADTPLKETDFDANQPLVNRYVGVGNTKLYIEKMCEFYSQLGRTKHTVIRHSNIYGPHDKYDLERSHVFGATVTKVMTAEETVSVWGTGEEKRDLLHVDDLMSFVDAAISKQDGPYLLANCGAGEAVSIRELVEKMIHHSGKSLSIEHDLTKPTIPTTLCLDCERAKTLLGWTPTIGLDEGIQRTLAWWKEQVEPTYMNKEANCELL